MVNLHSQRDRLELGLLSYHEEAAGTSVIGHYGVDKRTSLPTNIKWYVRFDTGETDIHFFWDGKSSLPTRVRINWSQPDSFSGPDVLDRNGRMSADMRLDGFSINDPIGNTLGNDSIVQDREQFRGMIDPVRSQTHSLIDFHYSRDVEHLYFSRKHR